jgi:hypothetical protein
MMTHRTAGAGVQRVLLALSPSAKTCMQAQLSVSDRQAEINLQTTHLSAATSHLSTGRADTHEANRRHNLKYNKHENMQMTSALLV